MSATSRDEVLAVIERAWKDARPPAAENLSGLATCIGEYGYVAEFFRDRDWREIDLDLLKEKYPGPHDACLSFMSPEAFRYFLPSYMAIRLRNPDSDDVAVDSAALAVTPPRYDPDVDALARSHGSDGSSPDSVAKLRAWWDIRVEGFSPAQRGAIVVFLEYVGAESGDPTASDALSYWRGSGPTSAPSA